MSIQGSSCAADPAQEALQAREQRLGDLAFEWTNSQVYAYLGPDETERELRIVGYHFALQNADHEGITDPKQRQAFVHDYIESYVKSRAAYTITSSFPWKFNCDGKSIVVSTKAKERGTTGTWRAVLGTETQMYICDKVEWSYPIPAQPPPIEVYASHSPSWAYRQLTRIHFSFQPEDICLLAGRNPYSIAGAAFRIASESPDEQVIEATIDSGDDAPLTDTITLDKDHGFVPKLIEVKSKSRTERYEVTAFCKVADDWFPQSVHCVVDRSRISHMERTWTLLSTEKAAPNKIYLNGDADALDYRLLGPDLTGGTFIADGQKKDHLFVGYQFAPLGYNLPTIEKLKEMRSLFVLHEEPKRKSQSSGQKALVLGVAGGIAVILGLFLGRKHRSDS